MTTYLNTYKLSNPITHQPGMKLTINAIFKKYILFQDWDAISKKCGLQLTTDTIHLNKTGGEMIVQLAVDFISYIKINSIITIE